MEMTSQLLLYWFVLKQSLPRVLKFANPGQTCNGKLRHREYSYENNNKKVFAVFCLAYFFTLQNEEVTFPQMFVNCCISERCYIPKDGKLQPFHYFSGTIFDINCIQKSLSLSPTELSASLLLWTVTGHVIQKDGVIRHLDRRSLRSGTACTVVQTGLVTTVAFLSGLPPHELEKTRESRDSNKRRKR
jgi:hypothetical protein